ncbi:hypothetical protein GPECTOR_1g414 [Gonium pectorale]|uniref:Uncharacterized protein n=1 Tax=Gonium pectorale TaxID=33097 RepID=A0A150H375_GONPE|nr:hypothetical protein GPECTOR_1g414 [Gonium pectorale]|eukprot:KXZ56463.1 hypothetical protein GPECTOR_1g414 [Gonium pectorale]
MRPLRLSSSTCIPNVRLRGMCFLDKDEWLPAGPSTDGDELAPSFSATDCTLDAPPAACRRRQTVCGFLNSSAADAGSEGPSNLELFVSSFAPVHDNADLALPQSLDAAAANAFTAVDAGAVEWPPSSPDVCVRQAPPTTSPSRLRSAVLRLCPIAEDPEAELLEQTEHAGTAAAPPAAPASSAPKLRRALPHGVRSLLLSADAAADVGCLAQSPPNCSDSDCGSGRKTATCSSCCSSPFSLSSRPWSPDSHSDLDGPSAACGSELCRRSLSSPLDSAGAGADGPAGSSPTAAQAPAVTASPRSGDWPEVPERRSDGHVPSLSEPLYTMDGCALPELQKLADCSRSLSSPLMSAEVPNAVSRKQLMARADLELVDSEAAAPSRRGLLAHLPFASCFGAPAARSQLRRGAAAAPPPPQLPPQPPVKVAPSSTSDDLEPPSPSDYWLSLAAAQAAPSTPPPPPPAAR